MISVLNEFASGLLTKFLEQVDVMVVFVLLFLCFIANNYFRWCAESDKPWARWMVETRRKIVMPLVPYLFSFIIYFCFPEHAHEHEHGWPTAAGEKAWEAIKQGTIAVAFYELWRRVGYTFCKAFFGAALTRIKGRGGI